MGRMVEVKVSELVGPALDWAVGRAQGWVVYPTDSVEHGDTWHMDPDRAPFGRVMKVADWQPSTRWAQCGQLIERYMLRISPHVRRNDVVTSWAADTCWPCNTTPGQCGATPLIAACRAIVASAMGGTVSVPAELLENA